MTISNGKYYCLGFDLALATSIGPAEMTQYVADAQRLYSRLLTFPLVTVAAVNGTEQNMHWKIFENLLCLM